MFFKPPEPPSLLTPKDEQIIRAILAEENLPLSSEVIRDAVMYKYGSTGRHAGQLTLMYRDDMTNWNLRETACAVAESYCGTHKHPEVDNLVHLVEWAEKHLEGIPFMSEYNPYKTGDYDPTRPEVWLDSLYLHLECYDQEAQRIDDLRKTNPKYFKGVLPGEGGESRVITNNLEYKAAKGGWHREQAEAIKAVITSPDFTPSQALAILREYWTYYVTPAEFCYIGSPIAFCLYCAAEFPDTPEARREFRHAVFSIHAPTASK